MIFYGEWRHRSGVRDAVLALSLSAVGAFLLSGCNDDIDKNGGVTGTRIAVYAGTGAWGVSAYAVKYALEATGREVDLLDEYEVQNSLDDYRLLIIAGDDPDPNITPIDIGDALGYTGRSHIVSLVERGGGYIGLGAGAYLAADSASYKGTASTSSQIGLFHGSASGPIDLIAPASTYIITSVVLTENPVNPPPDVSLLVLYYGGPTLAIQEPADALTAATFAVTGGTAAATFELGLGRVVLCAVHPEIEENDSRDGSDWGEDLNDGESDWFWLQAMTEWVMFERN